MSNFWRLVFLLILTALALLIMVPTVVTDDITVYDMETECREDRAENSQITQNRDGTFTFEGQYHVGSPSSRVDYDYTVQGNEITLDMVNVRDISVENYQGDCNGLAVYNLQTGQFEEGRYTVTLKHNGEVQERNVYRIKD